MPKLSTSRETRKYGPRASLNNKWEYINSGIYILSIILLIGGFSAQLSTDRLDSRSGLAVILIGIVLVASVNVHDLIAHVGGIDYCIALVELDVQLGLVEFGVPVVIVVGSVLEFVGILLFLIQMEKGYGYRLEKHALNFLIAGPAFWVIGSINNLCQVYERSTGQIQILQKSVQIPFLMGSLLFLVGGIFNRHNVFASIHHSPMLLAKSWVWLCIFGSLLFFKGGMMNVVKVFKMQQMDGVRLERLRGGALERLVREREGKVPLILEDNRPPVLLTPYKDVLVGGSSKA